MQKYLFQKYPSNKNFPLEERSQRTFTFKHSCQHILRNRNYCTGAHGYTARRLSHQLSLLIATLFLAAGYMPAAGRGHTLWCTIAHLSRLFICLCLN